MKVSTNNEWYIFIQRVLLLLAISVITVDIIPHKKSSLLKIISHADFQVEGTINKREI